MEKREEMGGDSLEKVLPHKTTFTVNAKTCHSLRAHGTPVYAHVETPLTIRECWHSLLNINSVKLHLTAIESLCVTWCVKSCWHLDRDVDFLCVCLLRLF